MSKVVEELIVLKISKLFKDKEDTSDVLLADNEFLYALERTATDLLSGDFIVEIKRGD